MNQDEAFRILYEYLDGYIFHPKFVDELKRLLAKELSGKESVFFKLLVQQLHNIDEFGFSIDRIDSNERLKYTDGNYYSLHLKRQQFNVRLLICLCREDGKAKAYFLAAFYERAGKGKTDYSRFEKILPSRLAELKGGIDNG